MFVCKFATAFVLAFLCLDAGLEQANPPRKMFWTWNPRHYASALRTKIIYEAYPQSQDEIDTLRERLHQYPVIHDPQTEYDRAF